MTGVISYSYQGAADALGLSVDVIKRAVAANDLPARYYGRKPLIPAPALQKWYDALPAEPRKKTA